MIDLLMIALQFAPVQSTGAFRSIELVKRLPKFGIKPTVLTIEPEQAASIFGGSINSSLALDLPSVVDIEYLRELRPTITETPVKKFWRMFTTLDDTFERRFASALDTKLAELGRQQKRFAAVYVSAPPFGATMLGKKAAERLKLPYLIDMRDAWAEWSPGPQISRLHYARKKRDERLAFCAANAIVAVTPELTDLFVHNHPWIPGERFQTITNGLSGIEKIPNELIWDGTTDTIDIGYVGSFYWIPPKVASLLRPYRYLQYNPGKEDWSYRSPSFFFRAWAELDKNAPEIGSRLRFHHVGHTPDWLMPMASTYGLADRCTCYGVLPKQDVAGFLEKMNCVLGTSMKRNHGFDYCLATKSFEYLAAGKPTLAFVTEGAQKRFYEEVGGALIFDPDAPNNAAQFLRQIVGMKFGIPVNSTVLKNYDHDNIAGQMASLIREVIDSRNFCRVPHAT